MKRQQTLAFYFQVRFKNERITLLIRIFSPLHLKLTNSLESKAMLMWIDAIFVAIFQLHFRWTHLPLNDISF